MIDDAKGIVDGLPTFRLYRQFVEGMEWPFHRVEADETRKRQLVGRLEQLERVLPEEFAYFCETFMSRAKVVEVRHYGLGDHVRYEVVEYVGACAECSSMWTENVHLLLQYDGEGNLVSFSFPPRDPEPMRTGSWLTGDGERFSARWEDVIDYMCDCDKFDSLYISPEGASSYINVSREGQSEWALEWAPYGMEIFRIWKNVPRHCDALDFVKAYMRDGTSDALAMFEGWRAVHVETSGTGHHVDVSGFLSACFLKAQRKMDVEGLKLIKTLEACGIDGDPKNSLTYRDCVPLGDEWSMLQALYRSAKKDLEVGEEECYRQKMLYLALHRHDDACHEMSKIFSILDPDSDSELWDFWTGRERNLSAEKGE